MANNASGGLTIGALSVSAAGHTGYAQHVAGAALVPPAAPSGYIRGKYLGKVGVVQLLTNQITASGGGIFQFSGQPNRGVVWSLTSGSGSLTALSVQTDAWGRAYAVYSPGGYSGEITVSVTYAP